ncbi:hypothetical protein [Campylobacter sp. CCS1377]|uniref:Uncharacterized protein n=1 Tax=Campylobacter sp. CCS1377 TaxID=3158229 RepID=A0AAU7E5G6_9BACT
MFAIYSDKANQFFWFSLLIVFLAYFILFEALDFLEKRKSNIVIINVEGDLYEMIKNNRKNSQDEIKNESR